MSDIKHHHIKYKEGPGGGPDEWKELIKKVHGVIDIRIDAQNRDVFVEYDLVECCEEAIEKWMVKSGFVLDDSFMERMKRGWIHYTEENERDALKVEPHSCCSVEEADKKKDTDSDNGSS
ncbi:MAG: hypothetical protein ACE5GY_09985 [Thermodesulfobacteriota bacterium]